MIKIVSWNINSVITKLPFLQLMCKELTPHIICLQETKLLPSKTFFLKNYKIYRKDNLPAVNASGGVMIAVHNSIHSESFPLNTLYQAVAATVYTPAPITICSLYLHHQDTVTEYLMDQLIKQLQNSYILTGDFNAHHNLWGSSQSDSRGQVIEKFLQNSDATLLNTGAEATHFNAYTGTHSTIDLSICSPSLTHQLYWSVSENLYMSDHYPQVIELETSCLQKVETPPRWILAKADWAHYQELVDLSEVTGMTSVDKMTNYITQSVINAALQTIPITPKTSKSRHQPIPWWNQECEASVKRKRKLFRQAKKHNSPENLRAYKVARAQARRQVVMSKRENWRSFISTINSSTPSTLLWSKIRRISSKSNSVTAPAALRTSNNSLTNSISEIAENFADHFYKVTKAHQNIQLQHTSNNIDAGETLEPLNSSITITEVQDAIRSMKNSAPGPDNIHPQMLKHLTSKHHKNIAHFFNHIWTEHAFPRLWRLAYILPIYKQGKDRLSETSYRPISLTNVLCKVFEKIVVKRLRKNLEERTVLDKYQSGFRQHKSTLDNLIFLTQEIQQGFQNGQYTVCVLFDIEKAFDRLHPSAILNSLIQQGIQGRVLHFITNFLSQRIFQVRVGNHLSTPRTQEVGTPQGSVLSPLLFILALNSIPSLLKYPVHHTLFADDLAIFVRGNDQQHIQQQLQISINRLTKWGETTGLKFSAEKTKIINFTRKRKETPVALNMYEAALPQVQECRFLGLIMDRRLKWTQHITELKQKCQTRLNLLKVLNGSSWGSDRKCLLRLYASHIRSILDYGCAAYSTACSTGLKQLDTIQNQALRICTGALRTSPIASVHVEANIPPLKHHRNALLLRYYFKIMQSQTHINAYRLLSPTKPQCSIKTLHTLCSKLLTLYNVDSEEMKNLPIRNLNLQIRTKIQSHLQSQWDNGPPTKLRVLKPLLAEWKTSHSENRRLEKVLTRLRIGHSKITHQHLYTKTPPPICETCDTPLDIVHLLNYCLLYTDSRTAVFGASPYPVHELLIDCPKNIQTVEQFLKLENKTLYSQI